MAAPNRVPDIDLNFRAGADSVTDPESLGPSFYVRSMNTVNRGGIVQTRPGYLQQLHYPEGRFQGGVMFKPGTGEAQIIVAVAGRLYVSYYPFAEYTLIPGITLSESAKYVYFCKTEQAVRYNENDGTLTLIDPRSLLIVQDGLSVPAKWDGSDGEHDGNIPIGTHMAWSGDRLWVANGRKLKASDIANPLSFREAQYINSIGSFLLPDEITGVVDVQSLSQPFLLVFTERTGTAFQSYIRIRTQWDLTPDFQKVILPSIGCVAHNSIVMHNGKLWWFAAHGVTNLDVAIQTQMTGKIRYLDNEMGFSKRLLGVDLSGICAGSYENYLLMSVPHADMFNQHTWVLDNSGAETLLSENPGVWNSFWTGTRPAVWISGVVAGQSRIFHVSVDRDGENRLWEAFQPERTDNGCPITCTLETRCYSAGAKVLKRARYADVGISELRGVVDWRVKAAAGIRGPYVDVCSKRVTAEEGALVAGVEFQMDDDLFAFKKQSRTLRTEDLRRLTDSDYSGCPVESNRNDDVDFSFQLCIMWNGQGAVRFVRFFAEQENEKLEGFCETDEDPDEVRVSAFDGSGLVADSIEDAVDRLSAGIPGVYTGVATAQESYRNTSVSAIATAYSSISQATADKQAECAAKMRAHRLLKISDTYFIGGGAFRCQDIVESPV